MKNENNIDRYFDRVKQNPPLIEIEKVQLLIAEAEVKVEVEKGHQNFLKFTIMTTLFAIIISVFLFWPKAQEEIPNSIDQIPNSSVQTLDSMPSLTSDETALKEPEQNTLLAHDKNKLVEAENHPPVSAEQMIVPKPVAEEEIEFTIDQEPVQPIDGNQFILKKKKEKIDKSNEDLKKKEQKYPEQILDNSFFIELTRNELENLGFSLKDNNMQLQFIQGDGLVNVSYFDNKISFGVYIDDYRGNDSSIINYKAKRVIFNFDETKDECVVEDIYPMLITNEDGEKMLKIAMPEDKLKDLFSDKYNKDFRTLLPVVIRENTFGNQPTEDIVFWFLPTDNFFGRLPENISKELLAEYDYVSAEDKSTLEKPECKYFDECRNTLDVSNFKVFPNPANSNATVNFTLNEPVDGRITLVDLSGRERQVLQAQTSFTKGSHRIDVDVSNVPEGIYLITLYSDKGIQTQRFIVAR